jgi:hypothetical protein
MLSAEPLTVGAAGYPQVFQEGETYRHLQITDRQTSSRTRGSASR